MFPKHTQYHTFTCLVPGLTREEYNKWFNLSAEDKEQLRVTIQDLMPPDAWDRFCLLVRS